jgi:enterochelin esterase family protein
MQKGQVTIIHFESQVLRNNSLGDPWLRKLAFYIPPGYEESQIRYPVVFLLSGFGSSGFMAFNEQGFSESFDQRMDRLIAEEQIQPMLVVLPDCMTAYGGSQYVNSVATGCYQDYLITEIVPFVKANFKVAEAATQWALMGKSSGGFGALNLAMQYPEIFGIAASHSGDMGFEYCYLPDFPAAMMYLEKNNGVESFLKNFHAKSKKNSLDFLTMNVLAMTAAYSPNPQVQPYLFEFPFDIRTATLIDAVWERWLTFDPARQVARTQNALWKLKLFFDCGTRDEYRLYAGARMLSQQLSKYNIPHCYEEFDDSHTGLSYRYDQSLMFISNAFRNHDPTKI